MNPEESGSSCQAKNKQTHIHLGGESEGNVFMSMNQAQQKGSMTPAAHSEAKEINERMRSTTIKLGKEGELQKLSSKVDFSGMERSPEDIVRAREMN